MSNAKKANLRETMPETALSVDRMRKEYGQAHVNDCIRRAIAGESNQFYAFENGHVLGSPFTGAIAEEAKQLMVQFGVKSVCFIRTRELEEVAHG